MSHDNLRQKFEWLNGIPSQCIDGCRADLFAIVRASYETPGRVYHSWKHIEACLRCFALQTFASPRSVFLALLFHDAVYVPGRSDNERRSSVLAEQVLAEHSTLPTEERQRVCRLILLTAAHHTGHYAEETDEAKLLDIDLGVLGGPWPTYYEYMCGVRSEFESVVSGFRYRIGRLHFLHTLLKQPNIFLTTQNRSKLDGRARENVRQEIALLIKEQGLVERLLTKLC